MNKAVTQENFQGAHKAKSHSDKKLGAQHVKPEYPECAQSIFLGAPGYRAPAIGSTALMNLFCLQVEVKRALPKEVQQQQAALRAAVAGRGMIPTIGGCLSVKYF